MSRRLPRCFAVLAATLALLACPKKPPPKPPPPPPDPKAELKKTVKDLYAALETQEPERLAEVLSADVMAFGLGPKETFTNRDALIEFMRQELIPFGLRGDAFKAAVSRPKIALAPGEESGWFYDFPRFERARPGKSPQSWKVRVSGHAVRDDQASTSPPPTSARKLGSRAKDDESGPQGASIKWRIDALHVSFAFPDADLYAPDAAKKLKPPETVGSEKGPDSDQLIGLTKRMLEDIALKVDRTSDSDEAVLIGTDPGDVYEGGAKFKELARPKLPELKKAQFSIKIEDGPRARVAPDGKSGWVSGAVVMRIGAGKKMVTLPAFRALWLFALEKDAWNLVSEHQSLPLTAEQRKPSSSDEPDEEKPPSSAKPPPPPWDGGIVPFD